MSSRVRSWGESPWPRPLVPLVFLLSMGASCGRSSSEAPHARHLLLVTLDTTRADHLEIYGYERSTSRALVDFAEQAVIFEQAYSTAPWTLPSLSSLMTGYQPSTHGCNDNDNSLSADFETLAEHLASRDFETGAVVNHVFLERRYGLDQGFDDYDQELVAETNQMSHKAITSPEVTDKGIAWLKARRAEGSEHWFLWLHYFDPHFRYQVHPELELSFGDEELIDLYDGEIAFMDHHLGRLFDELDKAGWMEDTAVVLVADHGEEFKDHGKMFHRKQIYNEVVRVPLVIRAPGLKPGRVTSPASMVDLFPTLVELLGQPAPEGVHGASLLPLLAADHGTPDPSERAVLVEFLRRPRPLYGLVSGNWKLTLDPRFEEVELYDLSKDPGERKNLAERLPDRVQSMREELESRRQQALDDGKRFDAAARIKLSEEDLEVLDELGYGGEADGDD